MLHNRFFKNCNNYKFPNLINFILVTISSFDLGSVFVFVFFSFNHSHYMKQAGSGLEIVKIKNIKNRKRKQETSFLVLFTTINLFCSLYRSKGRKFHFSWALWNLSYSLSNEEDLKNFLRYFLNTFCSRWVFLKPKYKSFKFPLTQSAMYLSPCTIIFGREIRGFKNNSKLFCHRLWDIFWRRTRWHWLQKCRAASLNTIAFFTKVLI